MNYRTFKEKLLSAIEAQAGGEVSISVERIPKNNGVIKESIVLRKASGRISPVIFLDDLYEGAQADSVDFSELADSLITFCSRDMTGMEKKMEDFFSYEKARDRIFVRVINRRMNEEKLKHLPFEPCLDLALVCYFRLSDIAVGEGMILIDDERLESWEISRETLFADAVENTLKQHPICLMNLNDMLEKLGEDMGEMFPEGMFDDRVPMYVLTNDEKTFGACALFYPEVPRQVAEIFNSSYFILPSSIHETILLPDTGRYSPGVLQQMVISVNKTEMDPKEILSNAVYYYDRDQDRLFTICNG